MVLYELDHWALFETMKPDQIDRLKRVIDKKVVEEVPADAFQGMLNEEIERLDQKR